MKQTAERTTPPRRSLRLIDPEAATRRKAVRDARDVRRAREDRAAREARFAHLKRVYD